MAFEDIDREDREEWLISPVTAAFVQEIMMFRARAVVDLVDQIKSVHGSEPMRLQHIGGKLAVVDELLAMLGLRKQIDRMEG
jgi:hypothetical protein